MQLMTQIAISLRLVLMVVAWKTSQSVVKSYFRFFFARSQLLCKLKDSYCGLMIPSRRSTAVVRRRCSIGSHANSTVALTAVIIHPGLSELYEILSINKVNTGDASLRNRRNDYDPWTSSVQDKLHWQPNLMFAQRVSSCKIENANPKSTFRGKKNFRLRSVFWILISTITRAKIK